MRAEDSRFLGEHEVDRSEVQAQQCVELTGTNQPCDLIIAIYFVVHIYWRHQENSFPGGLSGEATPVPIPNTAVKLSSADGTARVTLWESRSLPGSSFEKGRRLHLCEIFSLFFC